jgi:hypothetical protein
VCIRTSDSVTVTHLVIPAQLTKSYIGIKIKQ